MDWFQRLFADLAGLPPDAPTYTRAETAVACACDPRTVKNTFDRAAVAADAIPIAAVLAEQVRLLDLAVRRRPARPPLRAGGPAADPDPDPDPGRPGGPPADPEGTGTG
jgi:hypothetical protein